MPIRPGGVVLKIFVKVLESGIAFSLITAVVFAYYRTENANKKRVVVLLSLLIGFAAGIVSAILRSIPHLLNRSNLTFYSVIPVILSMLLILILMGLRNRIASRRYENLMTVGTMLYVISSHFYYLPSILLQMTSFAYYGESVVSTAVLFRVLGFVFAILLMVLSAVMVHVAAVKMSGRSVGAVAALSLLVMSVTQVNVVVQRLYFLRVIPKNRAVFQTIAFVSNHANLFYFLMMAGLAFLPILLMLKNVKLNGSFENRAQLRKAKYLMRHKRRIAGVLLAVLMCNIASLTFVKSYAHREIPLSPPEPYEIIDGAVQLPLELFEDGLLHRYEYRSANGVIMRFIVIKKAEGSYGVCLDACEICGPSGYFMRENDVICKLCDVVMNKGTIGFKGGCNPIPIEYKVHDKKIKIMLDTLDRVDSIFK